MSWGWSRASAGLRRGASGRIAAVTATILVFAIPIGLAMNVFRVVDGNITRQQLLPDRSLAGAAGRPTRGPGAENALDVLLVGTDAAADGASRADVIIIAHLSADRRHAYLVHVPRDLYVDITGHRRQKINAAYALGGTPLLVSTLERTYHVPIDHVALIDFDAFRDLTDTIGGVDLQVTEASAEFPPGRTHLDGQRALQFVRERSQLRQGDISRGRRQLDYLTALLAKGVGGDGAAPSDRAEFIDVATRHLTLDDSLTGTRLLSLAVESRDLRPADVTTLSAPWRSTSTIKGVGSVVVDLAEQRQQLGAALRDDRMGDYRDTSSPTAGYGR